MQVMIGLLAALAMLVGSIIAGCALYGLSEVGFASRRQTIWCLIAAVVSVWLMTYPFIEYVRHYR